MRALVIDRYGDPGAVLRVGEIDRPQLKRGQVLVEVAAAPIHPADIAFVVNGWYGIKRPTPTVPGLEGCGIVVESNAGPYGRWLIGKRVACAALSDSTGTWAEFVASEAMSCIPLPARLDDAEGAAVLVNPLTACSFIQIAHKRGHESFIQSAAASTLGQMVARLARLRGLAVINVVRRAAQAEALRAAGEAHVVCSADTDFLSRLTSLAKQLDARIAFDAVGGDLCAQLASAMPHGGKVVMYGGLSGEAGRLAIPDVIFHGKSIEGYWVPLYAAKVGLMGMLPIVSTIRRHADTIFATKVLEQLPLERFSDALTLQRERASDGKVLLIP